jgi:hypothetical protein
MTPETNERLDRHLLEDELELFLPGEGAGAPPPGLIGHVEACEDCRREVEGLRALHTALTALPALDPPAGFADAVMARVRLPVPWYVRALSALRAHWVAATLAVTVVAATAGLGAWWLASQPELTVGGLLGFTLDRLTALFWGVIVGAGRLVWESGLPAVIRDAAGKIGMRGALAGMAGIVLASLLTAGAMMKMLAPAWGTARTTRS